MPESVQTSLEVAFATILDDVELIWACFGVNLGSLFHILAGTISVAPKAPTAPGQNGRGELGTISVALKARFRVRVRTASLP